MLAAKTLIACAMLGLALPALAAPTTLDFEAVSAQTTLLSETNLYKDLGISFSGGGWGVASELAQTDPGEGSFYRGKIDASNQTPPFFSANRGAVLLWGGKNSSSEPTFVINVKEGFNEDFFLSYTSADQAISGNVSIFSDANGGGENLGGFALQRTGACSDGYLCNWKDEHAAIAKGKAGKSIVITGGNGLYYLDDFKFNLLGGTQVPEPGGAALSLVALSALAWSRSKRRVI